jgi:formylglycine-generating enzyme
MKLHCMRGLFDCCTVILVGTGCGAHPAGLPSPHPTISIVGNCRRVPRMSAPASNVYVSVVCTTAAANDPLAKDVPNVPFASDVAAKNGYVNSLGMKFNPISPGAFTMGSAPGEDFRGENETQHKVTLTRQFSIGIHLVTRNQFSQFVAKTNFRTDVEKEGDGLVVRGNGFVRTPGASWRDPGFQASDDHPVVMISWNDAVAFCGWLSMTEGRTYRLPTEAEWEYACRAGTTTAYFWGDDPGVGKGFANVADLTGKQVFPWLSAFNWSDGFVFTSPVGTFKPNPWGLYDMIGNVEEWCSDVGGNYPSSTVTDPRGARPEPGDYRILRGGSWIDGPQLCRCAARFSGKPDVGNSLRGFRVVLETRESELKRKGK